MLATTLWFQLSALAWTAPPPVLDCGSTTHNAGIVVQGTTLKSEIVCRNVSSRPYEPRDLQTGCPCLEVVPTETGAIPPGGNVHFRLKLETDGLTDRVGFPVEESSAPGIPPVALFYYEADVRPSVIAYPEYLDLGDWKKNGEKSIILVDTTGGSFGVDRATSVRGSVDIRWTPVGLLRVDDRWTVVQGSAAVHGYMVSIQAKLGEKSARKTLSDEVQLQLRHKTQHNVRIRIVGFSP